MGHCLCARVTEIMKLTLANIDFENGMVHIDRLKKQASTDKPMLTALFEKLNEWKENCGLTITRTRKCGSRGLVTFQDTWTWPTASLPDLFPAVRSDCKGKIMNKDCFVAFPCFF